MKKRVFIIAFSAMAAAAIARIFNPFVSWGDLIEGSHDIVIAQCTTNPQPKGIINSAVVSDIEVISVLKGSTKLGQSQMQSWFLPRQGDRFLMLANFFSNGRYTAVENYQIVPLDQNFQTNSLAEKTLNEQVNMILTNRLKDLDEELARDNEEKQRIEAGLNNQTNGTGVSTNSPPAIPKSPPTKTGSF